MNLLGFVQAQPHAPSATSPATVSLQLRVLDVLAAPQHLWVRGRLLGLPVPADAARPAHWWSRHPTAESAPPSVRWETQVSGRSLSAEVVPSPSGDMEASFDVDLPPTRRGWRVARNRVTFNAQTAEACGVALAPPTDATGVAVVLLPREATRNEVGCSLENAVPAARLVPELERLRRARHSIYYLACVPADGADRQAELALNVTALGWPNGHVIVVPVEDGQSDAALDHVLDRLRWLFAGSLDLVLVNLDPAARSLLARLEDGADRAKVRVLVLPGGETADPLRPQHLSFQPVRARHLLRYPLVFCHGMLACSMLRMQLAKDFNYFAVIRNYLRERGYRALFPLVTPTGGVIERARQLKEQIEAWTDEPVNVIAHSMGGLDARQMITHLGMADRVKSLTSISTPHHGSPLADWFLTNYHHRVPLLLALEALGVSVDGFRDCRPAACRAFNAGTPNLPQVRYFSYAGDVPLGRVTPMLRRGWEIITDLEGPNDGMVSVQSARWGEFLGTVHADHFAQTPDGLFIHPEESFDPLGFVMRVIDGLVQRGF